MARALAELALAPHLREGEQVTPPDVAVADFDAWLDGRPEEDGGGSPDMELLELLGRGRR